MMNFYKVAILLSSLFASLCFAEQTNVLIVNTDANVSYYKNIATEFKLALPKDMYQWLEFDLKSHDNSENELQEIIQTNRPKFIYCIGSQAYIFSQKYSMDEFLIFSGAINWEKLNISDKTYGVSNELEPEQEITLLRIFFPEVKKIGILYSEKNNQEYIYSIKKVSPIFNIEIIAAEINAEEEVNSALNALLPKIDLLWVIADPLVLGSDNNSITQILQASKQQQKPVYAYKDVYTKYGAALSISPDAGTIARQAAGLLSSLQAGKLPGSRVQFPAGSHVTLNQCTFAALKIRLNKEAFSSIDQTVSCPSP